MTFASREDAGQKLGLYLADQNVQADLVLGLPRGGVLVAAEVARVLRSPLDVLVVRKIGHPYHREFAVGALAEGEVVVLDKDALERAVVNQADLDEVIGEETRRLKDYQTRFHIAGKLELAGKAVLLIDDGLATGATMEAAALSAKKQNAIRVMVATPVASDNAVHRLNRVADRVDVLLMDPGFDAVGRYYQSFPQNTDEEVLAALRWER